ncbi:RNA polymerase sigma factor SigM [Kineosporia succinea]|uniref:RNA polymerase sigma-70 factor (ECF subfamily) n=1 Tax=Kineosporia succinea TaxID=84632 RepID=A0ABT9P142_9ACTN|nr:RNA polymerase sigma factor SigM [Kineosporia succinea]MDP9826392.1 RNA polymerase sigma-70 factor (ECF subfamily) [Kineosporia succinea]
MSDDGEVDDRRLIAAHLTGDPDAFSMIVRRHADRLWAVALRTTGDPEEAADAVQDAMVSALRYADNYRGDAAVSTWLHRIVVNASLDRLRRRAARPSVPLGERDVVASFDEHGATVARLDVRAALGKLPEAQRVALVLVDLEDIPVADVAQMLGVAEGTVKSRCSRARVALAQLLRGGSAPAAPAQSHDRRPAPAGTASPGFIGDARPSPYRNDPYDDEQGRRPGSSGNPRGTGRVRSDEPPRGRSRAGEGW